MLSGRASGWLPDEVALSWDASPVLPRDSRKSNDLRSRTAPAFMSCTIQPPGPGVLHLPFKGVNADPSNRPLSKGLMVLLWSYLGAKL